MTASGTYTFGLSNSDLVLEAFERIQKTPAELTFDHMVSARTSLNLELQRWANKGVNLWAVDQQSFTLQAGITSYALDQSTVALLDCFIRDSAGIDRTITPMSREQYADIPNKSQQGLVTSYWLNRLATPVLYFWLTPDGSGPYTFFYNRMRRVQDANLGSAETPDVPYRFQDALAAGLALRLARKFAPAQVADLKEEADTAWDEASIEDRERVDYGIAIDMSRYYSKT